MPAQSGARPSARFAQCNDTSNAEHGDSTCTLLTARNSSSQPENASFVVAAVNSILPHSYVTATAERRTGILLASGAGVVGRCRLETDGGACREDTRPGARISPCQSFKELQQVSMACPVDKRECCESSFHAALTDALLSRILLLGALVQQSGPGKAAGPVCQQVMSGATDVFFGDIGQHEPDAMTFGSFVSLADLKAPAGESPGRCGPAAGVAGAQPAETNPRGHAAASSSCRGTRRYYLAQATISGAQHQNPTGLPSTSPASAAATATTAAADVSSHESGAACDTSNSDAAALPEAHEPGAGGLAALAADFDVPAALAELQPDSLQTNLWMSVRCLYRPEVPAPVRCVYSRRDLLIAIDTQR